jgi:hypothetical protein
MRPLDRDRAKQLDKGLRSFARRVRGLPGIRARSRRTALIEQILDSIHRVSYVSVILARDISPRRGDPLDDLFDPVKAAVLQIRNRQPDEAFWLVFLFVHFGKHRLAGWRYLRDVYGRLGGRGRWDWPSVCTRPAEFRRWLARNLAALKRPGGPQGFGNHRKYQSLDPYSATGTGAAVASYVRWVGSAHSHQALIDEAMRESGNDPRRAFQYLYGSMSAVKSFGRTARFDYLTMVGRLSLAHISPRFAYVQNSTGPLAGARLLFGGKSAAISPKAAEDLLVGLAEALAVGPQVLEDSLCNWQKSPSRFIPFRG